MASQGHDDDLYVPANHQLIIHWLESFKFSQYANNFIKNGYDTFDIIKAIRKKSDLAEIDIKLKGHQTKLIMEIDELIKNGFDLSNINHKETWISCSVHEYIHIPHNIKPIVDTPEFQRLRWLKQLGTTIYVFPAASHDRFCHSLGVMHLARCLMLHLRENQKSLNITDDELFCVSVAGLLHDLGHGPFSHVFDSQFVPSVTDKKKFRHEDMSIKLIKKLFADNSIVIKQESLDLICALVSPKTHSQIVEKYKKNQRGFLFEIIANELNGIDVDKWDYFLRDAQKLGLDNSFRYTRLLKHSRVINDHICFDDKTSYDVQILFNTRYDLFKRIYSHKTSKAFEFMICDIMSAANMHFRITDKIDSAADFMKLDDTIIKEISRYEIKKANNEYERKANMEMQKAQKLIYRMDKRDIYKCVGYYLLDSNTVAYIGNKLKETKQNKNHQMDELENQNPNSTEDVMMMNGGSTNEKIEYHEIEKQWKMDIFEILKLQTNDFADQKDDGDKPCVADDIICCQLMSLSYGMETCHPIHNVQFYNRNDLTKSHTVDLDQITYMQVESRFREVIFRVFVKNKLWANECEKAVKVFCEKKGLAKEDDVKVSHGMSPKTIKSPARNKGNFKRIGNAVGTKPPTNLMDIMEQPKKKQKINEE